MEEMHPLYRLRLALADGSYEKEFPIGSEIEDWRWAPTAIEGDRNATKYKVLWRVCDYQTVELADGTKQLGAILWDEYRVEGTDVGMDIDDGTQYTGIRKYDYHACFDIHKWLNSDADKNEWWYPSYEGDIDPTPTMPTKQYGFLRCCSPEILNVVSEVKIPCLDGLDIETRTFDTTVSMVPSKFFLPSNNDLNIANSWYENNKGYSSDGYEIFERPWKFFTDLLHKYIDEGILWGGALRANGYYSPQNTLSGEWGPKYQGNNTPAAWTVYRTMNLYSYTSGGETTNIIQLYGSTGNIPSANYPNGSRSWITGALNFYRPSYGYPSGNAYSKPAPACVVTAASLGVLPSFTSLTATITPSPATNVGTVTLNWQRNKADLDPAHPAIASYRYRASDGAWSDWLSMGDVESTGGDIVVPNLGYADTYEFEAKMYSAMAISEISKASVNWPAAIGTTYRGLMMALAMGDQASSFPIGSEIPDYCLDESGNGQRWDNPMIIQDYQNVTLTDGTKRLGAILMRKWVVTTGFANDANLTFEWPYEWNPKPPSEHMPVPQYDQSDWHKWLNADAGKGEWWYSTSDNDVEPDTAKTTVGHIKTCSPALLNAISDVKITSVTAMGYLYDAKTYGGTSPLHNTTKTVDAKFFLISLAEAYGNNGMSGPTSSYSPDNLPEEVFEHYWEWQAQLSHASYPTNTTNGYDGRIYYGMKDHNVRHYAAFRSPYNGRQYLNNADGSHELANGTISAFTAPRTTSSNVIIAGISSNNDGDISGTSNSGVMPACVVTNNLDTLNPFLSLEVLSQNYETGDIKATLRWRRAKADVNPSQPATGLFRYRNASGAWSEWFELGSVDKSTEEGEWIPSDELWGEFVTYHLDYSTAYEVEAIVTTDTGVSTPVTISFVTDDKPQLEPPVIGIEYYGYDPNNGLKPLLTYTWEQNLVGKEVKTYVRYLLGDQTFDSETGADTSPWTDWELAGVNSQYNTVEYDGELSFEKDLHIQMYSENEETTTATTQADLGPAPRNASDFTDFTYELDDLRRDYIQFNITDHWLYAHDWELGVERNGVTEYYPMTRTEDGAEATICLECNFTPTEEVKFHTRMVNVPDDAAALDIPQGPFTVPRPILGLLVMPDGSKRMINDISFVPKNTRLDVDKLNKHFKQFIVPRD